jgi:hypothetical protein
MRTVRSDSNDGIIDVDCDQASPTIGLLNTGVITDKSGRGFMTLGGTYKPIGGKTKTTPST